MLEPLVRTIEVPCSQQQAFHIFMDEMGSWWPTSMFSVSAFGGTASRALHVEAREGGRIVEIAPDGREYLWGTIRTYEPPTFLSMDFHIPHPAEKTGSASLVEVRFTQLDDKRTRVELRQSNWEGLGDRAEMLRSGYGKGWDIIFGEAYKTACGG